MYYVYIFLFKSFYIVLYFLSMDFHHPIDIKRHNVRKKIFYHLYISKRLSLLKISVAQIRRIETSLCRKVRYLQSVKGINYFWFRRLFLILTYFLDTSLWYYGWKTSLHYFCIVRNTHWVVTLPPSIKGLRDTEMLRDIPSWRRETLSLLYSGV